MKTTEITFKDCWSGPYSMLGPLYSRCKRKYDSFMFRQ